MRTLNLPRRAGAASVVALWLSMHSVAACAEEEALPPGEAALQASDVPASPSLPEDSAPAPDAPGPETTLPERLENTLDSWQDFLDELLVDALGPNPERRYRVFGQRRTVDLGKRWTLALDERPMGRLSHAGTGIPAAGRPSRTWEILHEGRRSDWRFYNQHDGSGRENGGSLVTRLAPAVSLRTRGLRLNDDSVEIARTDAQTGLRVGHPDLWVEGFVRHARLDDKQQREGWGEPKPSANFGGIAAQWEVLPGLSLGAQHQRAIRPDMTPGDERLAGPRTEFGIDYRPGGAWSGSRVYWREAAQLGLLSSGGVQEQTTYKRVIGAEMPEGSPDGMVYAEVRQQSLVDDQDALLVLGWRHTEEFGERWRAQTLIETGIPVGGDNAVKSNIFDLRITNNAYPHYAFMAELQAVRTPLKNSAFASVDYTRRLTDNSLAVFRGSVTGIQPHGRPAEVPVNYGNLSFGLGWQEPEERNFSVFGRYTFLGRNALRDNVVEPDVADRRARIVFGEFTWQQRENLGWLLRSSRRWDRDDAFRNAELRTTRLTVLRGTYQVARRWRLSVHGGATSDSALPPQRGFGTEISILMKHKLVLALGYNPRGIDEPELSADDRLGKGVHLRLYIPVEATLTHWLRPRH